MTTASRFLFASVLMISFCFTSTVQADGFFDPHFFAHMDEAHPKDSAGKAPTGRKLVVERFFRLMSRTSIYALYCDYGNKKGWSTMVSRQRNRMTALDSEAARIFGGQEKAFNRFERYRNEESSRFVSVADRDKTCADAQSSFMSYVKLSPQEMEKTLKTPSFGDLDFNYFIEE